MPIIINPSDDTVVDEVFDSATANISDDTESGKTKLKVAKISPTFFHHSLNGSGKATGALNSGLNPNKINPLLSENEITPINKKWTTRNGDVKIRFIPTAVITEDMINLCQNNEVIDKLPVPGDRIELGRMTNSNGVKYVFSTMIVPQAICVREEGTNVAGRTVAVRYGVSVYACAYNDGDEVTMTNDITPIMLQSTTGNYVTTMFSANPVRTLFAYSKQHLPIVIDEDAFDAAIDKYNIATELIKQVEQWRNHYASEFFEQVIPALGTEISNSAVGDKSSAFAVTRQQIRYFESYGMSLDTYRHIYDAIKANVSADILSRLAKANTNLQFANMTEELRNVKPQIQLLPDVKINVNPFFSKQQQDVICTREPFVIVQSGAGTGKSTTLDGRLDALNQFGVPDHDVMVTSFTNTAADNMKAKRPNIRAMTLATMINEIYSTNFPQHELSSIETLSNCLRIAMPTSVVARDLETCLRQASTEQTLSSFTELSIFVELNFDDVMHCLDVVGQTTLELQSIICHQQIDKIVEPASVRTNYMLIDEVQDNSVFEFVYVIKRAVKYKQQLYMVGDPSQVMYEFRNANPKALNAMESSGVFATYKLTTNYRSNQDVLDFANKFLMDIEANQFAKIQLHSHMFTPQTLDTLKERVQVKYINVNTVKEFNDGFDAIVARAASQFVDDALARGEQVAFLARTRMHARRIQKMLESSYPGVEVASMVPDIAVNSTAFTTYIRKYWDSVVSVAPADAAYVIHSQMKNLIDDLMRRPTDAMRNAHLRNVDNWYIQNNENIKAWLLATTNGVMTRADFFKNMQHSLVEFEINANRVRASVIAQRNNETKKKNANSNAQLIVSTVHSVKGLEYDNVVALYEHKDVMPEDLKRLYYVAFTRAKNRLLVLGYGKSRNPAITVNYSILMKEIEDRIAAQQAVTVGNDDETTVIVDDDVLIAQANQDIIEEDAQYDASHDDAAMNITGFSMDDTVVENGEVK